MNIRATLWCILALWLVLPVVAQEESEGDEEDVYVATMTVTAERREEKLADVPVSVTAMDEEGMEEANIDGITDLSFHVPNLFISEFSAKRVSNAIIRGIGSGQGDPGVTTYVDGVPQLVPASANIEFLDLERVEVLRGPQGTLYGRNTIGGLIHYITKDPSEDFSFNVNADLGDYDHKRLQASLSGAIVAGKVYFRVGASLYERDGYVENSFPPGTDEPLDANFQDSLFMKASLIFKPTESWKITVGTHTQDDDDGGFLLYERSFYDQTPYTISTDWPGFSTRDLTSVSAKAEYYGNNFNFKLIAAQDENDVDERTDLDFLAADMLRRETFEDHEQTYFEANFSSPESLDLGFAKMDWVAGITRYSADFEHSAYTELRPAISPIEGLSMFLNEGYVLNDSGTGIYGQATFTFAESIGLTLGLRHESEDREWDLSHSTTTPAFPINETLGQDDEDFSKTLPHVALSYDYGPGMVYARYSESYRAGGYNRNTSSLGQYIADFYTYDEETATSIDIGYKGSYMDDRIYLAINYFQTDWDDRQLSVPIPGGQGQFYLDNAASAETSGIEIEFAAAITDYLDINAGLGTNDAKFNSYIDPTTGLDVQDNALPSSADGSWNLGLNLHKDLGSYTLRGRADLLNQGEIYFDAANTYSQESVELINARIGIERGGIGLYIWGKNLGDEVYYPTAIPSTIPIPGTIGWAVSPAPPKTIGGTISFRY